MLLFALLLAAPGWVFGAASYSVGLVDVPGSWTASGRLRTGTLLPSGKGLFVSEVTASNGALFDPETSAVQPLSNFTKLYKFAMMTGQGLLLLMDATSVDLLNPETFGLVATIDLSPFGTDFGQFHSPLADGRVVSVDWSGAGVKNLIIVDPSTQGVTTAPFTFDVAEVHNSAVLMNDGRVAFGPYRGTARIAIFDPSTLNVTTIDVSAAVTEDYAFCGGVLTTSGRVVFTPCNAPALGVFDPEREDFYEVDVSSIESGSWKFIGGVAVNDGSVLLYTFDATNLVKFNPSNKNAPLEVLYDLSTVHSGGQKYQFGLLMNNGKVVLAPNEAGKFLVVDADSCDGGKGYAAVKGVNQRPSCACKQGWFSYNGYSCVMCLPGTYKDFVGFGPCHQCPTGTTSAAGTTSIQQCSHNCSAIQPLASTFTGTNDKQKIQAELLSIEISKLTSTGLAGELRQVLENQCFINRSAGNGQYCWNSGSVSQPIHHCIDTGRC